MDARYAHAEGLPAAKLPALPPPRRAGALPSPDGVGLMAQPWNRMTREEQREESARIARAERVEQGLPEVCDDPAILAKVARIAASSLRSKEELAS